MTGKLKALGFALVAVFAISAIAASAASAAEMFHSDAAAGKKTIFTSSSIGKQVFKTTIGSIECEEVGVESGSMTGPEVAEVTIKPKFGKCNTEIGGSKLEVQIDMTSCAFIYTAATEKTTTGSEEKHARTHIECTTTGDEIDYTVKFLGTFRKCIAFPAQTPTFDGVTYDNEEAAGVKDIKVTTTIKGLKYTEVKETICNSASSDVVVNNGEYNGTVTLKGDNEAAGATSIFWQ